MIELTEQQAAAWLASINAQETDFGRNPNMSVAHDGGIVGLVQMQPGNWAIFAPPGGNPFDPHDALIAAARFLCAHGAAQDIRGAPVHARAALQANEGTEFTQDDPSEETLWTKASWFRAAVVRAAARATRPNHAEKSHVLPGRLAAAAAALSGLPSKWRNRSNGFRDL